MLSGKLLDSCYGNKGLLLEGFVTISKDNAQTCIPAASSQLLRMDVTDNKTPIFADKKTI